MAYARFQSLIALGTASTNLAATVQNINRPFLYIYNNVN